MNLGVIVERDFHISKQTDNFVMRIVADCVHLKVIFFLYSKESRHILLYIYHHVVSAIPIITQ